MAWKEDSTAEEELGKIKSNKKGSSYRNTKQYGSIDKDRSKKYYFYFTENKDEKPINLVIYKDKLIQLADSNYIVTKEKVTRLK